jgi:hypothetical protein
MNQKQRACLTTGFVLLVVTTLLPPWERWGYLFGHESHYGFLFASARGGRLDLSRLIVEWVLILFLTGGLFFLAGRASTPQSDNNSERKTQSQKTWRALFSLSIVLYLLIAALAITSFLAIRKGKKLESTIQSAKNILDSELSKETLLAPVPPGYCEVPAPKEAQRAPDFPGFTNIRPIPGAVPISPVGKLRPLTCLEQEEYVRQQEYKRVQEPMTQTILEKMDLLKRVREELGKAN